mmetsp:Transcript_24764/g.71038  ORF Transcript_24764/g.71038 Transcript_24764/m.71038 type:complete len:218 (+) Transcript_24764:258-911(+)
MLWPRSPLRRRRALRSGMGARSLRAVAMRPSSASGRIHGMLCAWPRVTETWLSRTARSGVATSSLLTPSPMPRRWRRQRHRPRAHPMAHCRHVLTPRTRLVFRPNARCPTAVRRATASKHCVAGCRGTSATGRTSGGRGVSPHATRTRTRHMPERAGVARSWARARPGTPTPGSLARARLRSTRCSSTGMSPLLGARPRSARRRSLQPFTLRIRCCS